MSVILDTSALDRYRDKLATLRNINATRLMQTWAKIIDKDNREGILRGLDKDGIPMVPVKYRPKPAPGLRVTKNPKGKAGASARAFLKTARLGQSPRLKKGMFAGIGTFSGIQENNNLKSSQYRLLGGPPLAPRDQFSRVVTNLKTIIATPAQGGMWAAIGLWEDVVTAKGKEFLRYHFNGIGQARRDLRGVRPSGITAAKDALANWARLYVREHFGR